MILLKGKLRKKSNIKKAVYVDGNKTDKKEDAVKLMIEHEISRSDGETDLEIQSFNVSPSMAEGLEVEKEIVLNVRPFASNRSVKYSIAEILPLAAI